MGLFDPNSFPLTEEAQGDWDMARGEPDPLAVNLNLLGNASGVAFSFRERQNGANSSTYTLFYTDLQNGFRMACTVLEN